MKIRKIYTSNQGRP